MVARSEHKAPSVLAPPVHVEHAHKWWEIGTALAIIGTTVASYFVGQQPGQIIGPIFAGVVLLLLLVVVFFDKDNHALKYAEDVLRSPDYEKAADRKMAADYLVRARYRNIAAHLALASVGLICVGLLVWRPLYNWAATAKPEKIPFSSLRPYDVTLDEHFLREAPFLEAVVNFLVREGEGEGKLTEIFLGTTSPFEHPTPEFWCGMKVDGNDGCEVTVYAFRRHGEEKRTVYETVGARYAHTGTVSFCVPPCARGDQLLIIGRLSVTKNKQLPDKLERVIQLELLNAEERQ
jgi:hypothetical protein